MFKRGDMERIVNKITWEGERIKRSRFIVDASPVYTISEAKLFLRHVEDKYADSKHHCYAFRLHSGEERISDSGEPRGSAGQPILQQIIGQDIVDCIVVVTRYFGGTKLGFGGLRRAYGKVTSEALYNAVKEVVWETERLVLQARYQDVTFIQRAIEQNQVILTCCTYEREVQFVLDVPLQYKARFCSLLNEQIGGRIRWITNTAPEQ